MHLLHRFFTTHEANCFARRIKNDAVRSHYKLCIVAGVQVVHNKFLPIPNILH
jgi:hypothetical protein